MCCHGQIDITFIIDQTKQEKWIYICIDPKMLLIFHPQIGRINSLSCKHQMVLPQMGGQAAYCAEKITPESPCLSWEHLLKTFSSHRKKFQILHQEGTMEPTGGPKPFYEVELILVPQPSLACSVVMVISAEIWTRCSFSTSLYLGRSFITVLFFLCGFYWFNAYFLKF